MKYTQNNNVYESTTQYTTDWHSIWNKVEKHVDKLQKQIYHAESIKLSDKVLLEPYVRLTDTYSS